MKFTKKYDNSPLQKEIDMGDGADKDGKEYSEPAVTPHPSSVERIKRITLVAYDPKSDEVEFQITGPNYWNKRHRTPLDQLSDYVVSKELF